MSANNRKLTILQISQEDEKVLFKDALFVFDTSALCRFYSLTGSSWAKLVFILELIKDRIWIPNRVSVEFNRHKKEEMGKRFAAYQTPKFIASENFVGNFRKYLDNIKKEIHKHPVVSNMKLEEWEKMYKEANDIIFKIRIDFENFNKEGKSSLEAGIKNDSVDRFVSSLNKGESTSYSDLLKIAKEGTWLYENKIPPGYMDKDDKDSVDRYGDLIVWKEVIDEAVKQNKPVIFITQDLKEDRNTRFKDDNLKDSIIPREELVMEFKDAADNGIWMYTISDFLKKLAEREGAKISDDSFDRLLSELKTAANKPDKIIVRCGHCNSVVSLESDDFFWEWDSEVIDNRDMGTEYCHTCYEEIDCPECSEPLSFDFSIYEYPTGSFNDAELEEDGCKLLNEPDVMSIVTLPPGTQELVCCRCGKWTNEVDDMGFCEECHTDF